MKTKEFVPPSNDDAAMIRDQNKWPCWPYLPLKKRGKNGRQWGVY